MLSKKIVLANDATLLSILENSFFRREGFGMVTIADGRSAFQAVEAEEPSLAVLDLDLLGEQALDCCRAIKQDLLLAATSVLVLLPADGDEALADLSWQAGCDAVIHRPLAAERFLDAACRLLGISRRLARRFPVSFQLAFLDRSQKRHIGRCANLNLGGMFLATETLFPVDTRLDIEFILPGLRVPLDCSVRVAWANHPEWRKRNNLPCGMGVQFVELNTTIRQAIREFVNGVSLA
jgi:uncharacterized protein (TIGR02266 family)